MTDPIRRATAASLVSLAAVLGAQIALSMTPYELNLVITPLTRAVSVLIGLAWIGLLIAFMVRRPDSSLWRLIVAWIVFAQVWVLSYIPIQPSWILEVPAYLASDVVTVVFLHILLAFPSGRLPDTFDRRLVPLAYVYVIGIRALSLMVLPRDGCTPLCDDPLSIAADPTLAGLVGQLGTLGGLGLVCIGMLELIRHHRRATPAGRRAMLPVTVAAPVWFAAIAASYLADGFLDLGARDATHGALSLVQALILPTAVLLGYVRTRLARGRLADLAVELGKGVPVGGLEAIMARTLRDPTLRLVFPGPMGDGYVDGLGRPFDVTAEPPGRAIGRIETDDGLLALLIHDPAIDVEDPGLVDAVGSGARLALENERLAAQVRAQLEEVQASRARIVDAADAERRRVERDLHDGAQQRLVALALRLDLARQNNTASAGLLDEATAELRAAVGEVRDLARGLNPPLLAEAGLGPAIEGLAERTPVPVQVDIPDTRYPPAVERAAYFVIAEALTNVARHAGATRVTVTVLDRLGTVSVMIHDDGLGGADPMTGSGLRGLADRVAAAGGRLVIESPQGVGTTIRADLPTSS